MNILVLVNIASLLGCTVHLLSLSCFSSSGRVLKQKAQGGTEGARDMDAVTGCHGAHARFSSFPMVLMLDSPPSPWCS